jgi:hypothetical protein
VLGKLKFSHTVLIVISIVFILNAIPYCLKYHTYWDGIGVKYNDPLSQRAFIENLKYHGISYKIDGEDIVWYTKSNEDKVHEMDRRRNHKLVYNLDLELEVSKLKNIGYEVMTLHYPEPEHTLVMWHEKN